jgi:hypothetical protein
MASITEHVHPESTTNLNFVMCSSLSTTFHLTDSKEKYSIITNNNNETKGILFSQQIRNTENKETRH